jgi:hypothetical protein
VNVLHWRATSAASGTTAVNQSLSALTTRVIQITGPMAQAMHDAVLLEKIETVAVHAGQVQYGRSHDLNQTGQVTGVKLPGFVAAPIFLNTPYAGRSRRGRFHFGGIVEAWQDAGVLLTPGLNALETVRDAIVSSMTTGLYWRGIIYSRTIAVQAGLEPIGPVPQNPGEVGSPWAPVESGTVSPVLGSMYSRRIGIGA